MNEQTVADLTARREAAREKSLAGSASARADLSEEIAQLQEKLKRRPNHPDAEQMRGNVASLKAKRDALHDPEVAKLDLALSTARKLARGNARAAAAEQLLKSAEGVSDDELAAEELRLRGDARAAVERADLIAGELGRRRTYAAAKASAMGLTAAQRAEQRRALDEADAAEAAASKAS